MRLVRPDDGELSDEIDVPHYLHNVPFYRLYDDIPVPGVSGTSA